MKKGLSFSVAITVMKISLIPTLILVSAFCAYSVNSVGQAAFNKEISVSINNQNVKSALEQIAKVANVTFSYSPKLIRTGRKISLNEQNQKLSAVLDDLLQSLNIKYEYFNGYIILSKRSEPSHIDEQTSTLEIQDHIIKGKVTEQNGQPVIGATVSIKSKKRVTATDKAGKFSITGDVGDVITFAYIGYKTQEVAVTDQEEILINLIPEETSLDAVVVIGYGVSKKINLTGAVESVKAKELEKMAVVNTETALAGKLPGLVLKQSSGKPGNDDPSLSIRGFGSPLIIIDGTQQGSFGNLDMQDIESISVLKDASAAIYGAQAGNGVILVTTKRGTSGKPKIAFNSIYTLSTPTKYPKMMNAGEYAALYNEAQLNDGVAPQNLRFSDAAIAHYKNQDDPINYPNTNWYDVATRKFAPQHMNNVNVDGGNESAKYFFSLGQASEGGLWKSGDSQFDRYNIRSNVDVKINKFLTASVDLSGRKENRSDPNISVNDIFLDILRSQPIYAATYPDPTKYPALGRVGANGLNATQKDVVGYVDDERDYFTGTFKLRYEIPFIKNLYAEGRLTYYKDDDYNKNWSQQFSTYNYDQVHDIYSLVSVNGVNALTESQVNNRRTTTQYSLNYEKEFGKNSLKGLLLFEGINANGNNFSGNRINYISTAVQQLFAGGTDNQNTTGTAYQDGRASYVGRLNYGYDSKYLLETTVRYDGSPRFAGDRRWGFFPSLSLAWIISDEKFMSKFHWLDNLKLRLSYSSTGNDNTGNFQYLTGYQYNGTYLVGSSPQQTIVSTGLANPFITWENLHNYNIGLETRLFGTFSATLDVFYRKREGMLANRATSLPYSFGAVLPAENINSQDNRGFEFVLGYRKKLGDFNLNLTGNISYSRAKWLHYDEPVYTDPDQINISQRTGKWVDQTFGYVTQGFFQSKQQIASWPVNQDGTNNTTLKPGDLIYKDINGDGKIDWRDQAPIGNGQIPNWYYGLNMDFSWKNFSLNALWQGATGFNFNITADAQSTFTQDQNGYEYFYTNRWTPNNPNAQYPRAGVGLPANQNKFSDFWYKSGDYLRLKSLMLAYSLPKQLGVRYGFSDISVFVAGTNLLTFDNLSHFGYDPEAPSYNNGLYYPQQSTYTLGLRVKF